MSTLTIDRPVETPTPSLPDADPNTLMREAVRRALHWFETVGEDGWCQHAAMRDRDGQPISLNDNWSNAASYCGVGRVAEELRVLGFDSPAAVDLSVEVSFGVHNSTSSPLSFHNDFRGFEPMKRALRTYLDATD